MECVSNIRLLVQVNSFFSHYARQNSNDSDGHNVLTLFMSLATSCINA